MSNTSRETTPPVVHGVSAADFEQAVEDALTRVLTRKLGLRLVAPVMAPPTKLPAAPKVEPPKVPPKVAPPLDLPPRDPNRRVYSVAEFLSLVGMSRRWFEYTRRAGLIRVVYIGPHVRVPAEEVERVIAAGVRPRRRGMSPLRLVPVTEPGGEAQP